MYLLMVEVPSAVGLVQSTTKSSHPIDCLAGMEEWILSGTAENLECHTFDRGLRSYMDAASPLITT
jgi:hypothetical protein